MKKKLVMLMLAAVTVFGLTACGDNEVTVDDPNDAVIEYESQQVAEDVAPTYEYETEGACTCEEGSCSSDGSCCEAMGGTIEETTESVTETETATEVETETATATESETESTTVVAE